MKKLVLSLWLVTAFVTCKKDEKTPQPPTVALQEKLTHNLNTLQQAASVYATVFKQTRDSMAAFDSMRHRLAINPAFKEGWFHNPAYVEIAFNNELKSPITFNAVANNGEHLTRGSGRANGIKSFKFNESESKKIKNKKVLVMIPYPDEFFYSSADIQKIVSTFHEGDAEMEVDIEVGKNADIHDLDRLGEYGLIILDVHGVKNGFFLSYISQNYDLTDVWLPDEVIQQAFDVHSLPAEKIANGQIEIGLQINTRTDGTVHFAFDVLITENYIKQLKVDLTDAVVFGNHCYSGHTADGNNAYNLPQAWRSKGVATYYGYAFENGYSMAVDNAFCKDMEMLLIKGLAVDGDTTGSAHLLPDGNSPFYDSKKGYFLDRAKLLTAVQPKPPGPPLYFVQFFDKNYAYEKCGDDLIDPRDKKVYQTVCIGNQVWMANDLAFDTLNSWCYDNKGLYCDSIGRLYTWSSAMNACPNGWHVPSLSEWQELVTTLGGKSVAGGKIKSTGGWMSPNTGATNSSKFSAMGSGWYNPTSGFAMLGEQTLYWTSTEAETDQVHGVMLSKSSASVSYTQYASKKSGYACRCIKD